MKTLSKLKTTLVCLVMDRSTMVIMFVLFIVSAWSGIREQSSKFIESTPVVLNTIGSGFAKGLQYRAETSLLR